MSALGYLAAAALGLAGAGAGLAGMFGWTWRVEFRDVLPLGGLALELDPLGGLFVALVAAAAVPASLAGLEHAREDRRGWLAYLGFVGAMIALPLAANALTFLLAWEFMSLASYALVLQDGRSRESVRAAWVYAVMTHAGLGCLMAGMLLVGAWTGGFAFADWRAAAPGLAPSARGVAFALLGLGFAAKAGVIPLHVWLPRAHPAAPAHVSALMSGVMIKLGIYGLLRAGLDWLGGGPAWWGVTVMLAGTVSALVGVLYALVDHDLKRLLAFHSIENIGIILIGLGAGMTFRAAGRPDLGVLGVAAGLYHTVNHAAFKALLFLAAGAVLHGTGTRNMEQLGGLIKRMPWTAAAFLVGSVAIAGLPPLNGFVSEWLTFQTLLQNLAVPRVGLNLAFTLALAGLALTAGLALACFVKAFGITFLALPRSAAAASAREAGWPLRGAMALLALACVALGLAPTLVLPALARVAVPLAGAPAPPPLGGALTLRVSDDFASLSTPAVAAALTLAGAVPLALLTLAGVGRRRRISETWGCGRLVQTARMEYTATAFANPFKRVFDFFYRPVRQLDIEVHPESRLFVRRIAYENPTRFLFEDWLYRPALDALHRGALRLRAIQSGSANLYLLYILVALLALLVLA
ncbi:MAG TPA: proton-conducting transporter membrane subunit [Candidatus Binatia bacterium]|nr:proton-conducting transporter membrane subunit [Candidatus Binatia bacterium]